MSTSGSKSNEHVAHFLVDIHIQGERKSEKEYWAYDTTWRKCILRSVTASSAEPNGRDAFLSGRTGNGTLCRERFLTRVTHDRLEAWQIRSKC